MMQDAADMAPRPPVQGTPLALALGGLLSLAAAAFAAQESPADGLRYGAGALLGAFAGFALYHAAFGFTGAWRRLVRERKGAGLRAQMLLVGATCLLSYPLIGYEDLTGLDMHPAILPMGLASAFGAALFGVGMQLGGGCASGTLFTAGGGSMRMLVTLAAFVAGSVIATHHLVEVWFRLDEWTGLPTIPGQSLTGRFGVPAALACLVGFAGIVWIASTAAERRAHGRVEPVRLRAPASALLRGPWPLGWGALALAAVGIGSFLLFSRPWGVTAGFAHWGGALLEALGVEIRTWGYWSGWRQDLLDAGVLADRTSVMNFGIVAGALAAAALAGRVRPRFDLTRRDLATALIGGLMMGYGARLAFGCNIGAYLGGLVSGSVHGLWWLIFGFLGSMAGVWLRSRLGMDPPTPRSGDAPGTRADGTA
ncbi:MAG: YeeE/YedE family protein [Paracoccaceae bacterium]